MQITEIYADDSGETHFRDIALDLVVRDFAPPSLPIGASSELQLTTSVFLELPPGWDPMYHATPRKQFAVMLSGHIKVTTTDGASADFRRGDVVLLNDMGSKGHLTLVQGQEPAGLLMVGVAD